MLQKVFNSIDKGITRFNRSRKEKLKVEIKHPFYVWGVV